jgi:hypothetical protein
VSAARSAGTGHHPRPATWAADRPALTNPAHPAIWIGRMTPAQKQWLVGRLETRALYGTKVTVIVLLDQDLIKHGQAEADAGHELSVIYGRLGQQVRSPDRGPVKRPDNYLGRVLAAIFTFGIYMFWWFYNQMQEPNRHFASNWAQEDDLVNAAGPVS